MKPQKQLLTEFKEDVSNFIENQQSVFKEIEDSKNSAGPAIKALLLMFNMAKNFTNTVNTYIFSSIAQDTDKLQLTEELMNYLYENKNGPAGEKRTITKESDLCENDLYSSFYDISEDIGHLVEYFAIVKNIDNADVPKEKPVLLLQNLNNMLKEVNAIEDAVRSNIAVILSNEFKKKEAKIKKAA
ncbi:MAG: hypothetical protein ACYDDB_04090 [bacterium]